MIDTILFLLKVLLLAAPFLLFVLLGNKANLKKHERYRQSLMPFLALVFCIVVGIFLGEITALVISFFDKVPLWLNKFAAIFGGRLAGVGESIRTLADKLAQGVASVNFPLWAGVLVNTAIMLFYIVCKFILTRFLKLFCKDGSRFYEFLTGVVYEKDEGKNAWYVKPHFEQGITFMKSLYISAVVLGIIGVALTAFLFNHGLLASLYYPAFGVILLGEIYFFLNGEHKKKEKSLLEGEGDISDRVSNYTLMRKILRRTFGDKLLSENTTVNHGLTSYRTNDEVLSELEDAEDPMVEAYGKFMRRKVAQGLDLDQNYLMSGLDLLKGKSILFNNPFYYDLIPYIFYSINRTILRHKKVLIVLGSHAIEDNVTKWCREGFATVTHIPTLWNIEVLSEQAQDPDVGIITRSSVHDLKLHEANDSFFSEVELVMLIEPSKLVTTAQIGLNSLVRHCRRDNKRLVFCSADKNCDGIVDSLSHILMTSLEEVSATNRHNGTSSYMCWEVDEDHLQHRLLPNLSRYLGVGTELSFAALKNQVPKATWYGGDAFPVLDMHWIAKQYHYDLLGYASLPTQQSLLDEVFLVSPNLWEASVEDRNYLTVEDESFNMFEVKREFSTRAREQGFINVISSDYLLKDYMSANDSIFNADAKAIPYIVADYADTERNIIYRLCLRLSSYLVSEREIRSELSVVDIPVDEIIPTLWRSICKCSRSVVSTEDGEELRAFRNGREHTFDASVIRSKRVYSYKTGMMEDMYYIDDRIFIDVFMGDLCNAEYISEDEKGERQYLGTELRGHVFQKYLPGQFFTFGGKYYEMQRLSSDGKVVVRRAADHIDGRPQYRQVRNYTLHAAVDSAMMGDDRDLGGIRVVKQYADISVQTPAYWQMKRYHDFNSGKRIAINGVPKREYHNKSILKIDFEGSEGVTPQILNTLALLMNEVFRSLYADNQNMVVAVTAGQAQAPLTYSLQAEEGCTLSENSIYIIEDSQLDIGLLVSVERNLNRIFNIISDYLSWHFDACEESLNPPEPVVPQSPQLSTPEAQGAPKQRKGIMKFFGAIGDFFKKLFRRKPRDEKKKREKEEAKEKRKQEKAEAKQRREEEKERKRREKAQKEPAAQTAEEAAMEELAGAQAGEVTDTPMEELAQEQSDVEMQESDATPEEEEILLSLAPPVEASEAEGTATDCSEANNMTDENVELSFEADGGRTADSDSRYIRKPYHERYYLLYGGTEIPKDLDTQGTRDLLIRLGYTNNFLEQARRGKEDAEKLEKSFDPKRPNTSYCDFCGVELIGTEYEVLSDGRERCVACSRTAVRTEKEFKKIYSDVIRNMKTFYGVSIHEPVHIQMVNAKKLHKRIGKSFVPTGKADGRVLGVAIKDKHGYSILLENGAPRTSAIMTMVHELTHIWQYLNWDAKAIKKLYGKELNLQIYEGMAKWSEIQYAYLINETAVAKREEIITGTREDEYGRGFMAYSAAYPLSYSTVLRGETPFDHPQKPL